jgi:hypothetical protein
MGYIYENTEGTPDRCCLAALPRAATLDCSAAAGRCQSPPGIECPVIMVYIGLLSHTRYGIYRVIIAHTVRYERVIMD